MTDLGNAEQFFATVSRFPRLEPKVKAFIFKLHFKDQVCISKHQICNDVTDRRRTVSPRD